MLNVLLNVLLNKHLRHIYSETFLLRLLSILIEKFVKQELLGLRTCHWKLILRILAHDAAMPCAETKYLES